MAPRHRQLHPRARRLALADAFCTEHRRVSAEEALANARRRLEGKDGAALEECYGEGLRTDRFIDLPKVLPTAPPHLTRLVNRFCGEPYPKAMVWAREGC